HLVSSHHSHANHRCHYGSRCWTLRASDSFPTRRSSDLNSGRSRRLPGRTGSHRSRRVARPLVRMAARPGLVHGGGGEPSDRGGRDRKSTRLNSSHVKTSYAVFCLKKKT